MRRRVLVFDTESNGFYEEGTHFWMFCAEDLTTGELFNYGGPEGLMPYKAQIRRLLQESKTLICHNVIKHDFPQMYKLGLACPQDWEGAKIIDTYCISQVLNPDRRRPFGMKGKSGPHSLQAYGLLAGRPKPEQEQWEVWDENMRVRCAEDVQINKAAFLALQQEAREDNWEWLQAIELEHEQAWLIAQQERNGFFFLQDRAHAFRDMLDSKIKPLEDEIIPMMPPKTVLPAKVPPAKAEFKDQRAHIKNVFKKNGEYTKNVSEWFGVDGKSALDEATRPCGGPFSKINREPPKLSSDIQVKEFLLTQGWVPDEYTEKGSPRLTESSYASITGELGKKVADYRVLRARRSQVQNFTDPENKGFFSMIRPDGRISAVCNHCGTNTGRATHKQIVNIPRTTSDFGKEVRGLFGVPEGKYLLGYDASGLELRCMANRMGDDDYIYTLLNSDIHTYNQESAGLPTRDMAKTFIYALVYGAGDLKIGRIIGGNSTQGKQLRYKFFNSIPALDALIKRVKAIAERGYLKGLDGRKIFVRGAHSALNALLQCDGAIVMKVAMVLLDKWCAEEGFKYPAKRMADIYTEELVKKVADVHDEGQLEVDASIVEESQLFTGSKEEAELWSPDERVWSTPIAVDVDSKTKHGTWIKRYTRPGELAVKAVREAGRLLNFKLPLDAEYKLGTSWDETH